MAKLIKEIPELSGKEADKFGEKMLDKEKLKEEIKKADNMTTSYTQKDILKAKQEGRKEAVEDEIEFLEKIRKRKHKNCNTLGLLKELKEERGNNCQICKNKSSQIHHIIPRRMGHSSNNKDNLLLICNNCHRIIESLIYSADIGKRRECLRKIQELKLKLNSQQVKGSNFVKGSSTSTIQPADTKIQEQER